MSYEIVTQVEKLFSDQEQWESFLDISNQRNLIRDTWWKKFLTEMNKTVNSIKEWGYSANNHFDYHWYINEYGINSFCLIFANFYGKMSLALWAPQNKYDIKKITELLQKEEYGEPIKAKFNQLHNMGTEVTEWKFTENIIFNGANENEAFDIDRMAWYANYRTTEFVSQVIAKVNNFREDKEVTDILKKINSEALLK